MSDEIRMLHMYENGLPEWVIAESPQEAVEIYMKYKKEVEGYGDDVEDLEDCRDSEAWDELPANQDFTFTDDLYDANSKKTTKTVAEWCKEHGKGYFATSEY